MNRVYKFPLSGNLTTTSGGVDLWAVNTNSVPVVITAARLDPCATSVSQYPVSIKLFQGAYRRGLGGTTKSAVNVMSGDGGFAVTTCNTLNTTKTAVSSGTVSTLDAGSWNLETGWIWRPGYKDFRLIVPAYSCLVVSLDNTPGGQTVSGCLTIQEISNMDYRWMRPQGPNAPWNRPVAGLPVDPNSATLASLFYNSGSDRAGNFNMDMDQSFAWYDASAATGYYNVTGTGPLVGATMPWNASWTIPAGTDKKVIVVDTPTGREWNTFNTSWTGTAVNIGNGSLVPNNCFLYEGGNVPSRGCGIEYSAMLLRPEEIGAGVIKHALVAAINNPDGTTYVAPATKLEHPGYPAGIPEGTRFALNITDGDITTYVATVPAAFQNFATIVAKCLRDYGWFVGDTSGGAEHFAMEDKSSASARWTSVGITEQTINSKVYPQDVLDGLITVNNIYAIVPSNQY